MQQTSIEETDIEIYQNCITTILNMLLARNWIDIIIYNNNFNLIKNKEVIEDIIEITSLNKKLIIIKYYDIKINSFKNNKEIENFINLNTNNHKILITADYSVKAEKQIIYINDFEVFKILEIDKDITKHHLVPKHILLSNEDSKKVMDEYSLTKKDMGRIYVDDPIARYLYAKPDNIIQIIRNSIISGYSTYYRLVVAGSILN